jgi:hypothetical protein
MAVAAHEPLPPSPLAHGYPVPCWMPRWTCASSWRKPNFGGALPGRSGWHERMKRSPSYGFTLETAVNAKTPGGKDAKGSFILLIKPVKVASSRNPCVLAPLRLCVDSTALFRTLGKLRLLLAQCEAGEIPVRAVTASVRSWVNHASHGNTVGLRKAILTRIRLRSPRAK